MDELGDNAQCLSRIDTAPQDNDSSRATHQHRTSRRTEKEEAQSVVQTSYLIIARTRLRIKGWGHCVLCAEMARMVISNSEKRLAPRLRALRET